MHKPSDFIGDNYISLYDDGRIDRKRRAFDWDNIPILEFLYGKEWDETALSYCTAMRPSLIRVIDGLENLDARLWRITVHLKKGTNIIRDIKQEVWREVEPRMSAFTGEDVGLYYAPYDPQDRKNFTDAYEQEWSIELLEDDKPTQGVDCQEELLKTICEEADILARMSEGQKLFILKPDDVSQEEWERRCKEFKERWG